MPSFIDLMADDVWSEADIKNRLHAEVRSVISQQAETELNRALQGVAMGMHTLSADERATLQLFKVTTDKVAELGTLARIDRQLLSAVMLLEKSRDRLDEPLVLPEPAPAPAPAPKPVPTRPGMLKPVPQPPPPPLPPPGPTSEQEADTLERLAAQAVIDDAAAGTLDLASLRHAKVNLLLPSEFADEIGEVIETQLPTINLIK